MSDVATATLSWNGLTPQIDDEKAKYHLSFIVDNNELTKQSVEYGAAITVPATTDDEGNDIVWYTYPETMPAHDLVVYGLVVKQPEPEVFVWLTMKDGQGTTRIKVKQGAEQVLTITPDEGWKVVSTIIDGGSRKITLQKGQVYVLTLGSRTLKFAL